MSSSVSPVWDSGSCSSSELATVSLSGRESSENSRVGVLKLLGSSSLSRGDSMTHHDEVRGKIASIHPSMAPSPMERIPRGQDSNFSSNVIE